MESFFALAQPPSKAYHRGWSTDPKLGRWVSGRLVLPQCPGATGYHVISNARVSFIKRSAEGSNLRIYGSSGGLFEGGAY